MVIRVTGGEGEEGLVPQDGETQLTVATNFEIEEYTEASTEKSRI